MSVFVPINIFLSCHCLPFRRFPYSSCVNNHLCRKEGFLFKGSNIQGVPDLCTYLPNSFVVDNHFSKVYFNKTFMNILSADPIWI